LPTFGPGRSPVPRTARADYLTSYEGDPFATLHVGRNTCPRRVTVGRFVQTGSYTGYGSDGW